MSGEHGDGYERTWQNAALFGPALTGAFEQVPPAFSAKKVAGERAYAVARRGEDVDLKAVTVHVGRAEVLGVDGDVARVRFACSRGTYIRALARDLGRAMGVGAHLVGLRRTRSGVAALDRAIRLDDLTAQSLPGALIAMASALETWPRVTAGEPEAADLRLGRAVNLGKRSETPRTRLPRSTRRMRQWRST